MNATIATTTPRALFESALEHVQSDSIRKWAAENSAYFLACAESAIKLNKPGQVPSNFATFITLKALG